MKENRRNSVLAGIAAYTALPSGAGTGSSQAQAHPGERIVARDPRGSRREGGRTVRNALAVILLLLVPAAAPEAQVSIQIGLPGVSIGINQPVYPQLVPVPGYPVYYDPGSASNFFFYDGMYWVYQGDNWYVSQWYNGPWALVVPQYVPVFILRVPVRYYRHPPPYFRGWVAEAPPRWGEHWGSDWERHHQGWDRWDRKSAPPPAPLPTYQKQYSENRYPAPEQQQELRKKNYRYQPRDEEVRQVHQAYEQAPQKQAQGKQERSPQGQPPQAPPPQQQPRQQHQPAQQAPPPQKQDQGKQDQGKQHQDQGKGHQDQEKGKPSSQGKPDDKGSDHDK
jgi:hypothetical protein